MKLRVHAYPAVPGTGGRTVKTVEVADNDPVGPAVLEFGRLMLCMALMGKAYPGAQLSEPSGRGQGLRLIVPDDESPIGYRVITARAIPEVH